MTEGREITITNLSEDSAIWLEKHCDHDYQDLPVGRPLPSWNGGPVIGKECRKCGYIRVTPAESR